MCQPRTAVLLHISDCRENHWLHAMVGTANEPGRIPTAIAAALEFSATILYVFQDEIVYHKDGRNEAEVIHDTAFALIDELPKFATTLPVFNHFTVVEIQAMMQQIFQVSNKFIINTADEIREALPIFKAMGIERVVFVSNADHISRIGQLVGQLWRDTNEPLASSVILRPAMSLYSPNSTMQDVVVFEPPVVHALGSVNPRRLFALRGKPEAIGFIDQALRDVGV